MNVNEIVKWMTDLDGLPEIVRIEGIWPKVINDSNGRLLPMELFSDYSDMDYSDLSSSEDEYSELFRHQQVKQPETTIPTRPAAFLKSSKPIQSNAQASYDDLTKNELASQIKLEQKNDSSKKASSGNLGNAKGSKSTNIKREPPKAPIILNLKRLTLSSPSTSDVSCGDWVVTLPPKMETALAAQSLSFTPLIEGFLDDSKLVVLPHADGAWSHLPSDNESSEDDERGVLFSTNNHLTLNSSNNSNNRTEGDSSSIPSTQGGGGLRWSRRYAATVIRNYINRRKVNSNNSHATANAITPQGAPKEEHSAPTHSSNHTSSLNAASNVANSSSSNKPLDGFFTLTISLNGIPPGLPAPPQAPALPPVSPLPSPSLMPSPRSAPPAASLGASAHFSLNGFANGRDHHAGGSSHLSLGIDLPNFGKLKNGTGDSTLAGSNSAFANYSGSPNNLHTPINHGTPILSGALSSFSDGANANTSMLTSGGQSSNFEFLTPNYETNHANGRLYAKRPPPPPLPRLSLNHLQPSLASSDVASHAHKCMSLQSAALVADDLPALNILSVHEIMQGTYPSVETPIEVVNPTARSLIVQHSNSSNASSSSHATSHLSKMLLSFLNNAKYADTNTAAIRADLETIFLPQTAKEGDVDASNYSALSKASNFDMLQVVLLCLFTLPECAGSTPKPSSQSTAHLKEVAHVFLLRASRLLLFLTTVRIMEVYQRISPSYNAASSTTIITSDANRSSFPPPLTEMTVGMIHPSQAFLNALSLLKLSVSCLHSLTPLNNSAGTTSISKEKEKASNNGSSHSTSLPPGSSSNGIKKSSTNSSTVLPSSGGDTYSGRRSSNTNNAVSHLSSTSNKGNSVPGAKATNTSIDTVQNITHNFIKSQPLSLAHGGGSGEKKALGLAEAAANSLSSGKGGPWGTGEEILVVSKKKKKV